MVWFLENNHVISAFELSTCRETVNLFVYCMYFNLNKLCFPACVRVFCQDFYGLNPLKTDVI